MLRAGLALIIGLWPQIVSAQQDGAVFKVEVALDWAVGADGEGPADPHWSRLIAVAHSSRYDLFLDGNTASSGLALVATNGRVSVLEAELSEARRRGRAGEPVVLPGLETGTGTFSFEIAGDETLSRLSFATMLAPSPDWFSGVSGVPLLAERGWIDTVRVPLWVWDAGADSGADFEAPNVDTQPRQSVRLLAHPAFLTDDGMRPIGFATVTRLR